MRYIIIILILVGLIIGHTALNTVVKVESNKAETLEQIYNW